MMLSYILTNIFLLTELYHFRAVFARGIQPIHLQSAGPITCNRSHDLYDLCSINGPTLLEPITYTLYAMVPNSNQQSEWLKTRPYPRKTDKRAMSNVKELTLTSAPHSTQCEVTHNSPALVFSAAGYTGNFFHDFNDGFIPLFITINSLFFNQDVILVISQCHDGWPYKYAELLSHFSRHPIIKIAKETTTHCFPSAIVGLISHGSMIVDPTLLKPHPKSLLDFRIFLENTYKKGDDVLSDRPKLVLVSRKGNVGRVILNQQEVIKAAEEIGFDVNVFEPTNTSLAEAFKIIDSSHAMLGVHGAGLTHLLFLRPGAILMQVVPIGTEWASDSCYKVPALNLGLEYMEYKIEEKESSLAEEYGPNDLVLKDPIAFVGGNYTNMRVYLRTQNVKLDIVRFKRYLRKVYKKAKKFMDMEY